MDAIRALHIHQEQGFNKPLFYHPMRCSPGQGQQVVDWWDNDITLDLDELHASKFTEIGMTDGLVIQLVSFWINAWVYEFGLCTEGVRFSAGKLEPGRGHRDAYEDRGRGDEREEPGDDGAYEDAYEARRGEADPNEQGNYAEPADYGGYGARADDPPAYSSDPDDEQVEYGEPADDGGYGAPADDPDDDYAGSIGLPPENVIHMVDANDPMDFEPYECPFDFWVEPASPWDAKVYTSAIPGDMVVFASRRGSSGEFFRWVKQLLITQLHADEGGLLPTGLDYLVEETSQDPQEDGPVTVNDAKREIKAFYLAVWRKLGDARKIPQAHEWMQSSHALALATLHRLAMFRQRLAPRI